MPSAENKIVLIVGDSMALPRPGVAYVATWPYLLGHGTGPSIHVLNRSRRAATTDLLHTEGGGGGRDDYPRGADCLESFSPDVSVIQLGIVDCAPRLIAQGSFESRLVQRLPKRLRDAYLAFIKRHRRRSVDRAYVPLERFRGNVAAYMERCRRMGTRLVLVEIAPFGVRYRTAKGRRKVEERQGVILETYPNLFTLYVESQDSKVSFSYAELLTREVELELLSGSRN